MPDEVLAAGRFISEYRETSFELVTIDRELELLERAAELCAHLPLEADGRVALESAERALDELRTSYEALVDERGDVLEARRDLDEAFRRAGRRLEAGRSLLRGALLVDRREEDSLADRHRLETLSGLPHSHAGRDWSWRGGGASRPQTSSRIEVHLYPERPGESPQSDGD
jgi:hypothetical protein